ncbi:MAG: hypothetical protein HRU38_10100 [Saccharospirillaceae bacterium]|nr:hypothetical protein [Pseudomonadales bacterium]NRB79004.1 hypothetical protein [Saccharospirillaceae bacterium]
MIGHIIKREQIVNQVNEILPILDNQNYTQAIKLLCHSNEILQYEDDYVLYSLVARLHIAIDEYLSNLPQVVEFENMCKDYGQTITLKTELSM